MVFCTEEDGDPLQAPRDVRGIAKRAIEFEAFSIACPGQWVILLPISARPPPAT